MDFFERQENARKGTKRLILLFGAGMLGLTLAVYLAVMLIFAGVGQHRGHRSYYYNYNGSFQQNQEQSFLWNPSLLLGSAIGTFAIVFLGSMFKSAELAQGGKAVATMLGGVPVNPNTRDPDERKLLNIVEEMSIASGVPMPQVYVLPQENGINAFAAGYSNSDAAIAVTHGAARLLNRDELQGVIGHEFSHILNGDMRLNMRLIAYVFGILCLTIIGRVLLRTRGRRNPLPILGLALIIIGWIGVFFGQLIQAAVSRERERLADASAVQFTRNPLGLASALKKIGGLAQGSRLESPQAAQASHMFFENGVSAPLFGLLATHPSLIERIRALDPSFDGKFPAVAGTLSEEEQAAASLFSSGRASISNLSGSSRSTLPVAVPPVISPNQVVGAVGSPNPAHLDYAAELRVSLPEELKAAARQSSGATALVYALLLSEDETVRRAQIDATKKEVGEPMVAEALRLFPMARQLTPAARLPLVDLALPALRQLSRSQFAQFQSAVKSLVEADGEIDLFEYVLQKILLRNLEPQFAGARRQVIQFYSLKGLVDDCSVLLSGLAHIGSDDEEQNEKAFVMGAETLAYAAQCRIPMVPPESCGLDKMNAALDRISQAVPQIKKNVLNACALTAGADGVIREEEAELLRAVADALDCPMPPFIAQAA